MFRSLSAPLRASSSRLSSRSSTISSLVARPSATSTLLPSLPPRRFLSSSPTSSFPDYRTPDPNRSTYQSRYDKLQLLLFRVVDEPPPNPDFDADGNPVNHSKRQIRTLMAGCVAFCFIVWGIFQPSDTPDLDQDKWWSFPIEWMEVVDEDEEGVSGTLKDGQYKVLTVRMPDDHKKVKGNVMTNEEGIFHIMVKDPNLQIERPYTIFHPPEHITGVNTQLSILVKKEPTGEVSKFIHGRKRFNWIELRGPFETKTEIVRPESLQTGDAEQEKRNGWSMEGWDRVVMISGGTGIAPFVQLLHTLSPVESDKPTPKLPTFTLLHTSSSLPLSALAGYLPDPDLLPTKLELADLGPGRFSTNSLAKVLEPSSFHLPSLPSPSSTSSGLVSTVKSLFSSPSSSPEPSTSPAVVQAGRPTPLKKGDKTLVLVSGPDGMIEAVSGPRGSSEIGGLLKEVGLRGEDGVEVRKFWNSNLNSLPSNLKEPVVPVPEKK